MMDLAEAERMRVHSVTYQRRTHRSTLALLVVLSLLAGWTARALLYPQSPRGLEAVRKDQRVVVQAVNTLARQIEAVDRRSRAFDRFTSQAISVLVKRK